MLNLPTEKTFDPANWNELRALGHQMLDDMFDLLQNISEQPPWQKPSDETQQHFQGPLPQLGQPVEEVYAEFRQHILPYYKGNIHPRFFSWVQTTGTPLGMLADMLASGLTPNVTIGDHAAMYVDAQVVNWCKTLLNFPADGSGILVSGGSMANLTGLLVARHAADRGGIRQQGVRVTNGPLVLYTSAESHSCIQKAAEVMGLGTDAVRKVPVMPDFRMDLDALNTLLTTDRAAGLQPFCVVGTAGTVNTGAIDPLDDLADLCQQQGLWLHIDGAFGALAKLVPQYQTQLAAIERADSVAFDLHKWLSMPYEVGCTLVRDAALHRETFALMPNYLLSHERGLAAGPDSISNYGIELSRGFKALKVWMSLKTFGAEYLADVIAQNIAQMRYLGERVEAEPLLELMAPVTMNIVCFRFNPQTGLTIEQLNALNKEILMQLHEQAIALPSSTILNGQYAIRAANVNHRTTLADLDALVAGVVAIGREF
ncbi:MAG: aminotransferase class V-fold PLP-dependent enzyme [Cytophagales bacterium]|nr:MAG: aminotransferase class V-fold PLP-dependent enzyme [Cytophagales bacterium]